MHNRQPQWQLPTKSELQQIATACNRGRTNRGALDTIQVAAGYLGATSPILLLQVVEELDRLIGPGHDVPVGTFMECLCTMSNRAARGAAGTLVVIVNTLTDPMEKELGHWVTVVLKIDQVE